MQVTQAHLKYILLLMALLAGISSASAVENPGKGRSLTIRFPAFSLNPGERVSGITLKASQGKMTPSAMPGQWRCEYQDNFIHCFSLHQSSAVALTGMLPELVVLDIPISARQIIFEASVQLLNNDGKEYSREFQESELVIK